MTPIRTRNPLSSGHTHKSQLSRPDVKTGRTTQGETVPFYVRAGGEPKARGTAPAASQRRAGRRRAPASPRARASEGGPPKRREASPDLERAALATRKRLGHI